MKYSEVLLTDDNFDEELEKLSEIIGIHWNNYDTFVKTLDDNFTLQTHDLGFDEWIQCSTVSDIGSDCSQCCQTGKLAYEFGNGFIIFNFENIL